MTLKCWHKYTVMQSDEKFYKKIWINLLSGQKVANVFQYKEVYVIHVGRTNPRFTYTMESQTLDTFDSEKDLGITISSDLKSSNQCIQVCNKASKMLKMIKRTISYKTPEIMARLYKTLVTPHLEYCVSVWSPHYTKEEELLERVQHRFNRMIKKVCDKDYLDRLNELNLWTLE